MYRSLIVRAVQFYIQRDVLHIGTNPYCRIDLLPKVYFSYNNKAVTNC